MMSNGFRNPFDEKGTWVKGNFHTHTTLSDGNVSPQERIDQYAAQGYNVLALTDHVATSNVEELDHKGMLVISGIETTAPTADGKRTYHIVFLNVPHGSNPQELGGIDKQIAAAPELGAHVILAHPYWCGLTINDTTAVQGVVAVEVFNTTCGRIGKAISSVHWDDMLAEGMMLPAIGVDDVHGDADLFGGWTMLRVPSLDVESVIEAIKTGCCYVTCGPVIEDFGIREGKLRVRTSPVKEMHFMSKRSTGRSLRSDGKLMTEAEIDPPGAWPYVRLEVVDVDGRRAWSNPLILSKSD